MEAYPKFSEDRDRMVIRPAEIDDIRMITTVMNASGGLSFYRAIFGTFHLPALIDQGYLSLVAESHTSDYSLTDSDKQSHIHGFISLNDQMSVVTEEYDFDSIINLVKEYIPLTVRIFQMISVYSLTNIKTSDQQHFALQLLDGK